MAQVRRYAYVGMRGHRAKDKPQSYANLGLEAPDDARAALEPTWRTSQSTYK